MCKHQVPQSGLVPASTLAGTYGAGAYGAGAYGAYGSLYGSSLPFLPSVFYRTRFSSSKQSWKYKQQQSIEIQKTPIDADCMMYDKRSETKTHNMN